MRIQEKDYSNPNHHLWTDLPEAQRTMTAAKRTTPIPTLELFVDQGYCIIPNAVRETNVDIFLSDIRRRLNLPKSDVFVEYWDTDGKRRDVARPELLNKPEAKILDIHASLYSSHPLVFAPSLLGFLRDVFQDEPIAFQSLYFEYGSQQPIHNDTAFVVVDPPSLMVASWIALEDVVPDSGELFYYGQSHRLFEQRFKNGSKAFDPSDPHANQYSDALHHIAQHFNFKRNLFRPSKGDALFWAADLLHGGEKTASGRTRRSLVTHYCPLRATMPYANWLKRAPKPVEGGGYILSATLD